MAGDRDLLVSLFRLFIDDAPKKLSAIEAHIQSEDTYQVERTAHSMKGAAATVGATLLCQLAAELEQSAKKGAKEDMARLRQEVARTCEQTLAEMREFCEAG